MTKSQQDIMIERFTEIGAIKRGHFILTSGLHSDHYINKDRIYSDPKSFEMVTEKFYLMIMQYQLEIDVITGPAVAGAILAAPIALWLRMPFVYPEKIDGKMIFRRGYNNIIKDKRVWIVEDVITTGGSVQKTMDAIESCGGRTIGIGCIWNRSGWTPLNISIKMISLIKYAVPSWAPKDCLKCAVGIPTTNPKEE